MLAVSIETLMGWIIGIVFLVAGIYLGPRVWRGETELDGSDPPAAWPLSEVVWRGVVRSAAAWWPLWALFFFAGALASDAPSGSTRQTVGMLTGLVALLLAFAIHIPVLLFNRPRWIVPPRLRDEPGALAEWRARRRGQRA
jgi:hypothetical protein